MILGEMGGGGIEGVRGWRVCECNPPLSHKPSPIARALDGEGRGVPVLYVEFKK